jgi:Xaa-Pro dipeptidase
VSKSAEVRVWQEDESPYRQIAGILKDRGAASGRIGVEERLRFFNLQRREEGITGRRIRRR